MVIAQAPCSAGRKKCRHGAYMCLLPTPEGGEAEITEPYVARFGQPQAGEKVFIRVQQQRNGWEDVAIELSEVVPVVDEAAGQEMAAGGVGTVLNELNGLKGFHKLPQPGSLCALETVQGCGMAKQGGGATEGLCTRGWFRSGSLSIPCPYRGSTRRERRRAGWGMQYRTQARRGRRRYWRELWRGS
jgi:hypothetical protein